MGGIAVQCADFTGEDKSCSALSGVLEGLRRRITSGAEVMAALARLEALTAAPLNEFQLLSTDAGLLLPHLLLYREELRLQLGDPVPAEAPDLDWDASANSVQMNVQAKWGAGAGWRFYCLHDLCQAAEVSVRTDQPVQFSRW